MIRRATGADVDALVALEAEVFGADAWNEASVRSEVDGPGRVFLVQVDDGGQLLGYAVSIVSGDIADLARIAVVGAARRGGLASSLLAGLLAETGGADRMLLEVSADNGGALAFYERHGFTRVDVRRRYYADGTDAVVMLCDLAAGPDDGRDAAPGRLGSTGDGGEDGTHG